MPSRLNIKKISAVSTQSIAKMNPIVKYVLIFALAVLLGFTVMYIINIVKYSRNFEKFVDVVGEERLREFVLIHSDTCGHCKDFMLKWDPVVSNMMKETSGKNISFAKHEQSTLAASKYIYNKSGFPINGFPTVVYVENGNIKDSLVGNVSESELVSFIGRNSV